ncbi:MAG: hypothetical protein Kow0029_08910 [Candidatus Rifleibacteriota bacterium]
MQLLLNIKLKRDCFKLEANQLITSRLTGIFGPSGSGKTTILECICGLSEPDSGQIKFFNKIFFDSEQKVSVAPQKRKVGIVFQDIRLFPHMSVAKNLDYGMNLLKKTEKRVSWSEIIELLELSSLLERSPESLSGGEKQRVAIGRALLSSPELLLLDEPFSALDQGMRQTILPYLAEIEKALNIPMIIVSHHLPDLKQLTEKILFIENGKTRAYIDSNTA